MLSFLSSKLIKLCSLAYLLTILCWLTDTANAQGHLSSSQVMQQGESAYHSKDYSRSARLYTSALMLLTDTSAGSVRYMAAYNGACSWALAGQPDSAFAILNRVLPEQGFGTFYPQIIKDSDFDSLHGDQRWQQVYCIIRRSNKALTARRKKQRSDLTDCGKRVNYSVFSDSTYWKKQAVKLSFELLYKKIASFNRFPEAPKKNWWTLYCIRVNDTLEVSYLVHIPKEYRAQRKTPLYVFLHGGVGRTSFSDPLDEIRLETPLLQRAIREQAFVILPFACKNFNWLYHQQAFETILREIAQVKGLYNIDDNRVYIGGHSDGARGAFWFALNQRTPFAACFGLNYFPTLLTGNTPLRNLQNEVPFYGISGIEDKGFNIHQVTQIVDYGRLVGANWHNTAIHGEHTLPYDKPDSVFFLFDELTSKMRNPVPKSLQWETDDVRNGRCFWINITQLDTLQQAVGWQQVYNPVVTSLKTGKDEVRNLNRNKSGAVIAEVKGHKIYLKTSRVKQLEVLVPVQWAKRYFTMNIHVNGRPAYRVQIIPNKELLLQEFLKNKDRTLLLADRIKVSNQ